MQGEGSRETRKNIEKVRVHSMDPSVSTYRYRAIYKYIIHVAHMVPGAKVGTVESPYEF